MSDDHQHSPLSRADTPIPNPMGRGTSAVDGIDIDAETDGTTETLSLNRLVLTEVKSDDPSRTEIPRSPSISIASDRSSHNSSTPSDTVVFSERSRRQGIEREAVPTGILLSGRDQARKEAIEATKKALDEASDRAKRDIQEIEERHRKKLAEIDLTQSTPPSTPQPAATEPQVQVKREATGPTTPSVKRESAATSGQATAPITPLRLYPNPDPAQSKVVQRAYSTGVDLNALAAAFEGKTLRAQADKPQKFSGQPLIGLPPSGHVSLYKDTKPKQTFNEWVGSVDLYFALCGMKDENLCFLFALSLLEGAARTFIEAAMRRPRDTIASTATSSGSGGGGVKVEPSTWSWLKETLRQHYQPAQRNQMVRDQLRMLKQEGRESVTAYYQRFTYYATQLALGEEEEYNSFRAGLRDEYRDSLDKLMRIRRGMPGMSETMSVEEAVNNCLADEMADQHKRGQQHYRSGSPSSYSSSSRGRPNSNWRGGYSSTHPANSTSSSRPAQLSTIQNRDMYTEEWYDEWGEEAQEEKGEYGWEYNEREGQMYQMNHEGVQLNAMTSSSSVPASSSSSSSTPPRTETRTCWNCNKPGHLKQDCRERDRSRGREGGRGGGRGGYRGGRGGNQSGGKKEREGVPGKV